MPTKLSVNFCFMFLFSDDGAHKIHWIVFNPFSRVRPQAAAVARERACKRLWALSTDERSPRMSATMWQFNCIIKLTWREPWSVWCNGVHAYSFPISSCIDQMQRGKLIRQASLRLYSLDSAETVVCRHRQALPLVYAHFPNQYSLDRLEHRARASRDSSTTDVSGVVVHRLSLNDSHIFVDCCWKLSARQ